MKHSENGRGHLYINISTYIVSSCLDRPRTVSVLKLNNGLVESVESLEDLSGGGERRESLHQGIKERSALATSVDKTDNVQLAKQEVDHKDEAEHKEESGDQGRGVGDGNVKKSNSGTEM